MYLKFYNLKENPFSVTSDPSFLLMTKQHQEAFSHMLYGVKEKKGFLVITGEVGTGKTTLCKAFINHLNSNTKSAFIFNPDLLPSQLLRAILTDLGIECKKVKTRFDLFDALNSFLITQFSEGNNVVLIIDEAQNLKPAVLEQIRMLSNLETTKQKLFQIVLVGQPELKEKLDSPNLRQLRQRVAVTYHINPLEQGEMREYISHRLKIAGAAEQTICFTDDAIEKIYSCTKGIPRLVNILCDRSLLVGFVKEKNVINAEIVEIAKKELAL